MRKMVKVIGLGVAALALAVECAFIPSEASAITAAFHSGPVRSPGGSYFEQGQVVNLCLSETNESRGYTENGSQVLGNCAAGFTQLSVVADPSGVPVPTVTVTATVTATPAS